MAKGPSNTIPIDFLSNVFYNLVIGIERKMSYIAAFAAYLLRRLTFFKYTTSGIARQGKQTVNYSRS